MKRGRPLIWSVAELAHACDVVVQGLRDRTLFDSNPTFIEAMETAAKLLRGDATNIRGPLTYSARRDGTYLLVKVKEATNDR